LNYDADNDGVVDTVSHMDGSRVLLVEVDADQDGRTDRWEHYGEGQRLEKVGFSRAGDGIEDAWLFAAMDGTISKIELSTARDGRVDRTEYYERNALTRAEQDTTGDGRPDKWETYVEGRLGSVAFDTLGRGMADRRLTYGADGTVRFETDSPGERPPPPAR
jgi:hypothetical protein